MRRHAKRKNNHGTNTARISPMHEVEPYIVELIDQLGKMHLPITCQEGLQLANSLVNGNLIMENIQSWRRKHHISFRDEQQLTDKDLGKCYWQDGCYEQILHFHSSCTTTTKTTRIITRLIQAKYVLKKYKSTEN